MRRTSASNGRPTIRKFAYQLLKPASSLVDEEDYLRMLSSCYRRRIPLCRAILYCYRSVFDFQLSPGEIALVLSQLRRARNFLVFGVGRDTPLWAILGPTETCFAEHDRKWLGAYPDHAGRIHLVNYSTKLEQHQELLQRPEALQMSLPPAISREEWDLILVDAPQGQGPRAPGRMQSIYAASQLVRPGGVVMVHDIEREIERNYAAAFLGMQWKRVGRLGLFRATWNAVPSLGPAPKTTEKKDGKEGFPRRARRWWPFGSRTDIEPRRVVPYYKDDDVEINVVNFDFGKNMSVQPRHDREVLLLRDPWYPERPGLFAIKHRIQHRTYFDQVYYLSNTRGIHFARRRCGFNSHFINLGCFINEDVFTPAPVATDKLYDAVIVGRFSWHHDDQLKRHHLTAKVSRLAVIDPKFGSESSYYRDHYARRSNCAFFNTELLSPPEVAEILRQSHCGLILSALEGVCRASSEYLLCGLPVVSTASAGGRDVWYDDYNSIVVEPSDTAVAAAVHKLKCERRDPHRIRAGYLETAEMFRRRFVSDVLTPICRRFGVGRDPQEIFDTHPFRWWQGAVVGSRPS